MKKRTSAESSRMRELKAALQAAANSLDGAAPTPGMQDAWDLPPVLPERHLTDDEFIQLSLASPLAKPDLAAHLSHCPDCAAAWARLLSLNAVWEDPDEAEALAVRRRQATGGAPKGLARLFGGFQTSLGALRLPQAACAEGADTVEAEIHFPIYEGDAEIVGLRGTLRRRRRDYYARIAEVGTTGGPLAQRKVLLTILDTDSAVPLLLRQVDVGTTVLLGTDLSLTEQSALSAGLLAAAEGE
jgi:hypothetical protein